MAGGMGTAEGAAFFSNFSFRADDTLRFDPPPRRDPVPGMVRAWQLSRPLRALAVDLERAPGAQGLTDLGWRDVVADETNAAPDRLQRRGERDAGGVAYVSDSVKGVLYRLSGASVEEWLRGPEVDRPNGVCLLGKRLVWGNNGDGTLRAADLATKATSVLADLGGGLIDGIEPGRDGSLLVSHNEGRLYLVSPSGEVRRLLDTTGPEQNLADFDYVPELDLVVCPGWIRGNLVAYRLDASRPW